MPWVITYVLGGTICLATCIVFGRVALGVLIGIVVTVHFLEWLVPPDMRHIVEYEMRERFCSIVRNTFGPPAK